MIAREPVRLPVLGRAGSALTPDGGRRAIRTASVTGRYDRIRRVVFAVLGVFLIALPFVQMNGHPLVLLDVARRRFHLFGMSFNAQDSWLLFFVASGLAFSMIVTTSIAGRAFCGFVCPQTVLMDGIIRPLERLFEGTPAQQERRDHGPRTVSRIARKVGKHAAYAAASTATATLLVSLFVPIREVLQTFMGRQVSLVPWVAVVAAVLYFDLAWFREQVCLVVCPYGRLQSILTDPDSLGVGYDVGRGEPRGKPGNTTGDCVDCHRCIAVCPTAIDIRDGSQLDCIGCTACIDACDEIMTKLGKPTGLIRWDSEVGLRGEKKRIVRPRLVVYAVLAVVGFSVATFAMRGRNGFEATVLRARGAPFVVEDDRVRNSWLIHIVNKDERSVSFELATQADGIDVSTPNRVEIAASSDQTIPLVATRPLTEHGSMIVLLVTRDDGETEKLTLTMVGPK